MKPEDKVCTLDQARRLKELGVIQESYWIWYEVFSEYILGKNEGFPQENSFSAFDVAELGVMIGEGYWTYTHPKFREGDGWAHEIGDFSSPKTQAYVLADDLIWGLKENLIKVEDVNKRLRGEV